MQKITLLRNTIVDGQALSEGDSTETSEKTAKYLVAIGKAKLGLDSASKTEYHEIMTNEEAQEAIDKGEAEIPEAAIIEPPEKAVMPGPKSPKGKKK